MATRRITIELVVERNKVMAESVLEVLPFAVKSLMEEFEAAGYCIRGESYNIEEETKDGD